MKIVFACDHAGFELTKELINHFSKLENVEIKDFSPELFNKDDSYVDNTKKAKKFICKNKDFMGVFVCGTGFGVCISANRQKGIRAVRVSTLSDVKIARQHNDMNVMCLGAKSTKTEKAIELISTMFETEFEGGRHLLRVKSLDK